ncbi:MAG: beta-N-acetylhexosaminidase [Chloroflexi bacterium]|nr:beta-N-acetylhexosaminidase [Chloroflexota bacterium]
MAQSIDNTLAAKIGGRLLAGFDGLTPPDYILEWLAQGRIGGVILFARNVETPAQVAALTRACHDAAPAPILIGIDQEGGTVARLRHGFTESPGALALGAAGSEALAEAMTRVLATEMRAVGINWTYAPVVDVTHDIHNASVGTRSPGMDAVLVSRMGAAQARGFAAGGVAATAKHFPGLGNTPVDTHDALAVIDGPLDYLYANDLMPFRTAVAAGVPAVMISHVKFPALDPDYPATLSPALTTGLLRETIGFQGVACTDCLEMRAITDNFGAGESAVLAALAGADVLLFSHTRELQAAAYDALLAAAHSGRLPTQQIDTAAARVWSLKQAYALRDQPPLGVIRAPEHLEIAARAARAGVVLLKGDLPLNLSVGKVGLVEFVQRRDSAVMEHGKSVETTPLAAQLAAHIPGLVTATVPPGDDAAGAGARALAETVETLIVATRSAHLDPDQFAGARRLLESSRRTVLLCLRNPYDAGALPAADVILCTCGDSAPSITAAVDALRGVFTPTGRLPVEVAG